MVPVFDSVWKEVLLMKGGGYKRHIFLLNELFKHRITDRVVIFTVVAASFIAVASIFSGAVWLNDLNLLFSAIFAVELSLRFLTYDQPSNNAGKKEYVKEWWLDWIATIPWDLLLGMVVPGAGTSVARLLRLPRIIRILRFRHVGRSRLFKIVVYRLKRLIEGSLIKQMSVLGFLSAVTVAAFALLFNYLGTEFEQGDNIWFSTITMFSSDSLFEVADQSTEIKILILILSTIGIVVFNGILIAIIVGRLVDHLGELKKGHGEVYEKNHIILLGRSEFVPHILDELDTHCRIEKKFVKTVVMRETVFDNDDLILRSRPRVEVIPRVGGAWSTDSLERISMKKAKGVIVFGGISESYDDQRFNDALVTKTLVSMNSIIKNTEPSGAYVPGIVLNYADPSQMKYAKGYLERDEKSGENIFKDGNPVFFDPVFYTAKLFSCLCVNPHSYRIYNELLTAEGSEFHVIDSPFPKNTKFSDILNSFPKAIPVGFRNGAKFIMVPDPSEMIPEDGKIVVLAPNSYDASRIHPAGKLKDCRELKQFEAISPKEMKNGIAIIGVNDKLPRIVEELHHQNSGKIFVIDNQTEKEFSKWYKERLLSFEIEMEKSPEFIECHFKNESEVENSIPFKDISTVIILADGLLQSKNPDQIDADTFSRLLMVQHLFQQRGRQGIHLIIEILTKDTEHAVSKFEKCSHIVGPLFIGRLLTTFVLYPFMEEVFSRLIKTGDIDIVCRPLNEIRSLIPDLPKTSLKFSNLLNCTPSRSIPLGWVEQPSENHQRSLGNTIKHYNHKIFLNPDKNTEIPENAEIIYVCRD